MRFILPSVLALLAASCGDDCYPVPTCEALGLAPPPAREPFDWAGIGTVVAVGPSHLTVDFDGTQRRVALPARPPLEAGQTVEVEGGVISAEGRAVAAVVRSPLAATAIGGELSLGSVQAERVPMCRRSVSSSCVDLVVVWALEVGDVWVEPGQAATVTTADGRRATLENRWAEDPTSCGADDCLRIDFGSADVALVYED